MNESLQSLGITNDYNRIVINITPTQVGLRILLALISPTKIQ